MYYQFGASLTVREILASEENYQSQFSSEEKICETELTNNLPLRKNYLNLGNYLDIATNRFYSSERKLNKNM